jgi:hypothetical protein
MSHFSATVSVYNESDYTVTDILILRGYNFETQEFTSLSRLEKGAKHIFNVEWQDFSNLNPASQRQEHIIYYINEGRFGVEHEEGVKLDYLGQYYSPKVLLDGSHAHIFIRNNDYEIQIENGGIYEDPGPPGSPPGI